MKALNAKVFSATEPCWSNRPGCRNMFFFVRF